MRKYLIILLIITVLLSCKNKDSISDEEIWNELDKIEDLVGFWTGNNTLSVRRNRINDIPKTTLEILTTLNYYSADWYIGYLTLNMDFDKYLDDWLIEKNKNNNDKYEKIDLWGYIIRKYMAMENHSSGGQFIIQQYIHYNIQFDIQNNVNNSFFQSISGKLLINNEKNKLKIVFNEPLNLGVRNRQTFDIILIKQ